MPGWDKWQKWGRWARQGDGGGETSLIYLLYDEFTTAEAAPLTSPRTCEPGPGLIHVVDTANHLSISSSQLVCDGGKATPGDPAVWIGADVGGVVTAVTMQAGYVGFFNIIHGEINKETYFGFDQSTGGNAEIPWFDTYNSEVRVRNPSIAVGSFAASQYKYVLAYRSVGAHFIQDGILLWVDTRTWATADLLTTITVYNASYDLPEIGLADLPANNYPQWGPDFSTVTDSLSAPVGYIGVDCNADFHARITFTYEAGKEVIFYFRDSGSNQYVRFLASTGGAFQIYDSIESSTLYQSGAGVFSDGVSYQVDLVVEGTSIKGYINNVVECSVSSSSNQTVANANIYNDLTVSDIELQTHPYPSLGIATDRLIAPQNAGTATHTTDFLAYMRNITVPSAGSLQYDFRGTP